MYALPLNELKDFLKQKGIYDTFRILAKSKNYKVEKHAFYNELNKFSYYNSFFRVKDKLIEKGLINIKKYKNKKYIYLTKKGLNVYNKLVELNNIIKTKN